MAGLDVDTSSYPKAIASPNPLDTVGKVIDIQRGQQGLQSGALTIDKQKLDLVNQRFDTMAKDFTSLMGKSDLNEDQIRKRIETDVKLGIVTPDMAGTFITQLPPTQGMKPDQAAGVLKQHLGTWLNHAQTIKEAIDTQFGQNATTQDQSNVYTGVEKPAIQGGGFVPATRMPIQVPPTQPVQNAQGAPGIVGPSAPSGVYPVQPQNNLPVVSPAVSRPVSAGLPIARPMVSGPTAPTVNNGTEFNNRFSAAFPNAVQTGPSPGVASAMETVGKKSGEDYATDLTRAKNFQADLYPMQKVLDIVKESGTQAFGPGTPQFNTVKSALATWLPNTDQKTIDNISNFEQAKKYLVQAARTAGNTGTNDQLAAAFEANPNVTMNGATIDTIVKSNIALRKMQHAQTLLFGQQGLPDSEYSKWISKNQNVLDPRAFGFDNMDNNAKTKLMENIATKDKSGNWIAKKDKQKEFNKFEQSLSFANDAGLIEPPGRK